MAQIALFNVTNDVNYRPQNTPYFPDNRWQEAKKILAWVLQQHAQETKHRGTNWLMDRMVAGDFPADGQGYCNGITCIANSGEHSQQRGRFTAYDLEGDTYIYEAPTGDLCIANIPDDLEADTEYYRIAVLSY